MKSYRILADQKYLYVHVRYFNITINPLNQSVSSIQTQTKRFIKKKKLVHIMIFNELFKKRGFHETLYTLYSAKNYALSLPEFFEKLSQEMGSYYNAFFRVKGEMQKYGIISYKKNREGEKVIGLTPKGVEIMRILKTIDELFSMNFDEYKDKMKKMNKIKSLRQRRATIRAKQIAEEESLINNESESTESEEETEESTKKD